jgi:hypothetical protein
LKFQQAKEAAKHPIDTTIGVVDKGLTKIQNLTPDEKDKIIDIGTGIALTVGTGALITVLAVGPDKALDMASQVGKGIEQKVDNVVSAPGRLIKGAAHDVKEAVTGDGARELGKDMLKTGLKAGAAAAGVIVVDELSGHKISNLIRTKEE